jgi:hypothetical protein
MAVARENDSIPRSFALVVCDTEIYRWGITVRADQGQLGIARVVLHRGAHAGQYHTADSDYHSDTKRHCMPNWQTSAFTLSGK